MLAKIANICYHYKTLTSTYLKQLYLTFNIYYILVQNVQGLVQKTYLSYRGTFPEQNIINK